MHRELARSFCFLLAVISFSLTFSLTLFPHPTAAIAPLWPPSQSLWNPEGYVTPYGRRQRPPNRIHRHIYSLPTPDLASPQWLRHPDEQSTCEYSDSENGDGYSAVLRLRMDQAWDGPCVPEEGERLAHAMSARCPVKHLLTSRSNGMCAIRLWLQDPACLAEALNCALPSEMPTVRCFEIREAPPEGENGDE